MIWVLNGVNIGRLGTRQTAVYGGTSYDDLVVLCEKTGAALDTPVDVRQTDSESELVGWLHAAADGQVPVLLNPAAWSHYSIAVRDACALRTAPLVEVHLSNIHAREDFRHTSLISAVADGVIAGLGVQGYALGIRWLASRS